MSKEDLKVVSQKTMTTLPLGVSIRVGAKSKAIIQEEGVSISCEDEASVQVQVDIGDHWGGILLMSLSSYEALMNNHPVKIETFQQHIEKLKNVKKRKK